MVPVDHVARCCAASVLWPSAGYPVLHISTPLPITYNQLFAPLVECGYAIERSDYLVWRRKLEQHVLVTQDNALFPLLHFVLDDLPTSTKSPELDDANTAKLLDTDGGNSSAAIDSGLLVKYISWLVNAQFLHPPSLQGSIPLMEFSGSAKAVGRSGRT